jgi:hypothetical protein
MQTLSRCSAPASYRCFISSDVRMHREQLGTSRERSSDVLESTPLEEREFKVLKGAAGSAFDAACRAFHRSNGQG